MTRSAVLSAYRVATAAFDPLAPLFLRWRAYIGREDRAHISERLGSASLPRPQGKLAWLQGRDASEARALSPLIERLAAAGLGVLVTTRNAASGSARFLPAPPMVLRQPAPLETPKIIRRFLDHWRPDLVLIAGSELWPNLILETSRRNIPLALLTLEASAGASVLAPKWPPLAKALLPRIDLCFAKSAGDAARFAAWGARRAEVAGNPLYDFSPAPVDAGALARLTGRIGARPAWAAVGVAPSEEDVVLAAHRRALGDFPDLVTIVAPRHGKRAAAIKAKAATLGLDARLWTEDCEAEALPELLVAGGLGDAGLCYRAASVVFLGGSLGRGGSENPVEPAKLGCAILHGPDVGDFEEAYGALDEACGAVVIEDEKSLADEVAILFADSAELRARGRAAAETMERLGGASDRILRGLEPYLS